MPPLTLDTDLLARALASALATASGQKSVTPGTPTGNLMYGNPIPGLATGFFGVCGLDNSLINASVGPRGIESLLPSYGTDITNPEFPILTGFEQVSGQSESSESCADCIYGESEGCILTAQFGKFCRGHKEISLTDINTRSTAGEMRLRMFGDVTGADGRPIPGASHGTLITDEREWAMVEAGVLLQRVMQQMIWQGNPVNNVGQGYWEFPGFDLLIGTGKVDAHSGATCPAADSDIKDFGYTNIEDTLGGHDIVGVLSMLEAYLYHVADRTGLTPCQWVLAMRPELWYALTEVWACKYMTYRCVTNQSAVANVDVAETIKMRDGMRQGMFLWVNGRQIPVITDDGIYEHNNANSANCQPGQYASDIYMIPLTVRGTPVTYFEYQDFSRTLRGIDVGPRSADSMIWVTDGGRFMVDRTFTNRCYHVNITTKPRLILRTPHLAGRVQNVLYSPLQHFRSPFDLNADGSADPYFVKGGVSTRGQSQLYSEWNLPR